MGFWLQTSARSKKKAKEEEIPKVSLKDIDLLYCFGLDERVYFQHKDWLEEKDHRRLIFLESDPEVFHLFLRGRAASKILKEKKVFLENFPASKGEVEDLARRFPFSKIEVLVLPHRKSQKKLRLELLRKSALSNALATDRLYGDIPFENFLKNLKELPRAFYANGLKNAFSGVPAIVCGAGGSLEEQIETIQKLEDKALIIAGGSTLAALSSKGIMPHFGIAIDPNYEEYLRFKNSFAFETPLLFSTRVHHKIFQTCNGPFGYMRSSIGGMCELWIEEKLGLKDPFIGESLPDETVSVSASCIAWAQFLGCNPLFLSGVDLAYLGGKHYASGVVEKEKFDVEKQKQITSASDRMIKRKNGLNEMVYTAIRWIMEANSISCFAKKHPEIAMFNASQKGLKIRGVPFKGLEEGLKDFPKRKLRKEVFTHIQKSPMPKNSKEVIQKEIDALRKSLERLIENLRILAGEKAGSSALAELEIEEEIASCYLFYDIRRVFPEEESFWKSWLSLALRYRERFPHIHGACFSAF